MQLDGQTVLITGANRGLGAHLVTAALDAGAAKVWAATRDPRRLAADVVADPRIEALQLDVTDQASVDAAADRATDVGVLVNNAGVLSFGSPLTGDLDSFARDLTTNYLGSLRTTRAFAPTLERHAPAAVVNVLTVLALAPITGLSGYCASKAAAHSMTQALRAELKDRGVEVLAAYAGGVDTDMVAAIDMAKSAPGGVAARIVAGIEAGEEMIWPDAVAAGAGATYLAGPRALEAMLAGVA